MSDLRRDLKNVTGERLGWSVPEISTSLPLSEGFIRKEIKSGALKSRRIGRRIIVLDNDLKAYLLERGAGQFVQRSA